MPHVEEPLVVGGAASSLAAVEARVVVVVSLARPEEDGEAPPVPVVLRLALPDLAYPVEPPR